MPDCDQKAEPDSLVAPISGLTKLSITCRKAADLSTILNEGRTSRNLKRRSCACGAIIRRNAPLPALAGPRFQSQWKKIFAISVKTGLTDLPLREAVVYLHR
jgi:hypothetical protein